MCRTPGLPGTLVWAITAVQAIPAYAESGLVGGTVRAFVGPVMAAVQWHLAMGIELRLNKPGAASHSLIATLGREARERLLPRLGIAVRDRDAAQITRDRATRRALSLAVRLAELTSEQRQDRRGRRLTRRLSKAIGRAGVGTNPEQRNKLLAQLAARRNALALSTVPLTGDHSPETGDRDAGTETVKSEPEQPIRHMGTGLAPVEVPAQAPQRDRGPTSPESGTEPTRDRGPTTPSTGTEPTGDREHKAPLKRKPAKKATGRSGRPSRSHSPQTQRPPREPEQPVDHLVERLYSHGTATRP